MLRKTYGKKSNDIRIPLGFKRDLRSLVILHSSKWWFRTDVSGKHIDPTSKCEPDKGKEPLANTAHKNRTHKIYTFVFFSATFFDYTFDHHQVEKYRYRRKSVIHLMMVQYV